MPYAIAIYDSGDWKQVRSFANDEEAQACIDAIKKLHKFESDHTAFVIADTNGREYEQALDQHIARVTQRGAYHPFALHVIASDANRHICNLLASFSSFFWQSERLIRNHCGGESEHFQIFKQKCSEIYDSSQAYRLMYALRNFAQHYAMPVTSLQGNIKAANPRARIIIGFRPADLLSSGWDWKERENQEFEALGEFVDLTPWVVELREKIRYLFGVQLALCAGPYIPAAELLEEYMDKIGAPADRALVVSTDVTGALRGSNPIGSRPQRSEDWLVRGTHGLPPRAQRKGGDMPLIEAVP